MSGLPKHLRPRWRYLAVAIETWPGAALTRSAMQGAIWDAARDLLGDAGSAAADLTLLHFAFGEATGEAIVRTRRGSVEEARAAIACIEAVDGRPVGLHVRAVSGTVRTCKERHIGQRRQTQGERTVAFGNAERSAVVRDGRLDIRIDGAFAGATNLDFE